MTSQPADHGAVVPRWLALVLKELDLSYEVGVEPRAQGVVCATLDTCPGCLDEEAEHGIPPLKG